MRATSKRTGETYDVLEVRDNGKTLLLADNAEVGYGGYFPNPGSAMGIPGGKVSFTAPATRFEVEGDKA